MSIVQAFNDLGLTFVNTNQYRAKQQTKP